MISAEQNLTFEDLEKRRVNHSVLLLQESYQSYDPEYRRAILQHVKNLEASHISEVLAGDTRTHFEFESRKGRLYALQPEGYTDWLNLHENGVKRAELRANKNPRFNFYAEIARAELEEAQAQEAMIQEGEPSTLFTISLCGDDVASAEDLRLVGRDPELRRGYLRASVYDGQKLHLYSYSKDGLNLSEARQIYKEHFGIHLEPDFNSVDILKTRVLKAGADHKLLDRIAPLGGIDAYKFVLGQTDLIEAHIGSLRHLGQRDISADLLAEHTNNLRYDIMSSFKQRLEGNWIEKGSLADSVAYAGSVERSLGTEFAGCDSIIISRQNNPMAEAGYLNAQSGLRELWVWRDGYCKVKECPSQSPKAKKVKVGPCSVCKNCQNLFDSSKDPAKEYKKSKPKKAKASVWPW